MDASEYENIAKVEDKHWWYRGMAAISMSLLNQNIKASVGKSVNCRILDAGCGPGGMFQHLAPLGQPFGIDFHPLAVQYAKGRAPIARASIDQLPFASSSFDIITSFDVICHRSIPDDIKAFSELQRVLKPGGKLLLRLPALQSMQGQHDIVVHTLRRYSAPDLRHKLEGVGFQIVRLTYANTLLFPLIYLRRKLNTHGAASSDVEMPSPFTNRVLESALLAERALISHMDLPIGVSLFALASKP